MAKEKKYERKRRRLNITVSDQAYSFLKKQVTNASRFIDRLLEEAEKGIGGAYITIAPIGMDPAGIEPAASTLRTQRIDKSMGSAGKNEDELLSLAEVINKHVKRKKDAFMQYLTGNERFERGITSDRATAYYNYLLKLPDIPDPQSLIALKLPEYPVLALRALIDYLEKYTKVKGIAGYSFDEWMVFLVQPKREAPAKVPPVPTDQVTAAYTATPDDLKTFFKLLMYTGLRSEHALRLYEQKKKAGKPMRFTREEIITFQDIPAAAIDSTPGAAKRGKKSEIALFPASFIEELTNYEYPGYVKDTVNSKIRGAGTEIKPLFPDTPPFTVKLLRKYHAQILLNNDVDTLIIDYLQGRKPRESAVLIQNYASPDETAARQYVERVLNAPATFPILSGPAAPPPPTQTPPAAPPKQVSGLASTWEQTGEQFRQTIPINPATKGPNTRSPQYNNYTAVKVFLTDPNTPPITRPDDLRAAILQTEKPTYKNRLKGLRAWIRMLEAGPLGYPTDEWIDALSKIK